MTKSLQEQLLKAGLTDKNKVKQAKKSQHNKNKAKNKTNANINDDSKQMAEKAQQSKADRDRELNMQRQREANEKALHAQIRQLVEVNAVSYEQGEIPFHFTDKKKVKRINVPEIIADHLSRAKLAIVKLDERYLLVPAAVADKVSERDSAYVITTTTSSGPPSGSPYVDDDPYADYQIPDDLMW